MITLYACAKEVPRPNLGQTTGYSKSSIKFPAVRYLPGIRLRSVIQADQNFQSIMECKVYYFVHVRLPLGPLMSQFTLHSLLFFLMSYLVYQYAFHLRLSIAPSPFCSGLTTKTWYDFHIFLRLLPVTLSCISLSQISSVKETYYE